MAYDNNMKGALFLNKKKEKGSKQPDRTGKCEIGGKTFYISGWLRQTKDGDTYLSLEFQVPQSKKEEKETPKNTGGKFDDMDDDIPF